MPLHDSREQRERWAARAQQVVNAIDDLRRDLSVAIRQRPSVHIMLKLAESDVHLAVAQNEIAEAISRMEQIQ